MNDDPRSEFGDRLDALASKATAGTPLRHPAVLATSTRSPYLAKLAWAAAGVILLLGGAWWLSQSDDTQQTIVTDDGGASGVDDAGSGEDGRADGGGTDGGVAPVPCRAEDALTLLQSGLPTFDYDPAGSYRAASEQAELVVTGTITSIVRTPPVAEREPPTAYTELTVSDVRDLDGNPVADVTVIAYTSWWADSSSPDPLAEAVAVDGLRFVGFLSPWSGVRGDYFPGLEGLYVACDSTAPAAAVVASAAGPGEPASPTLDELVDLLAPAVPAPIECTGQEALDGLAQLIHPGFAFDYEPAGSFAALAATVGSVVVADVTHVSQVANDGPLPDDAFIVVALDNVETIAGTEAGVTALSIGSVRAQTDDAQALAAGVPVDGVQIVAFVFLDARVPGGAIPAVEGVYIACDRTDSTLAVFESAAGDGDPAQPSIDELTALIQRPTELSDEEAEEAGAWGDHLTWFAGGDDSAFDQIPLADEVTLALGSDVERIVPTEELRDRNAWLIERPEGYAGFSGPFSALRSLAANPTNAVEAIGPHPHCVNDPLPVPVGFEDLIQISIQPTNADSCIDWYAVDLFYDLESRTISGISLSLFGP